MKRIYQCCLMGLLLALLALPALAEENLYDKLLPLMDAAAAENLADASAAAPYVGVRPMGAEMSPEGDAVVVLGDLYRAGAQLDTLPPEAYGEVEWLDQRVVVQLQKDGAQGWRVVSFQLDAELLMEDAAQAYFDEAMKSYTSQRLGFSVQYPAVFDCAEENENGLYAALPEEKASFLAERAANEKGLTLAALVEREQQDHADAKVRINEMSGVACASYADGGMNVAMIYAASDQWIYHVKLSWADDLNADFVRYSEYVMNSLSVDELGIG